MKSNWVRFFTMLSVLLVAKGALASTESFPKVENKVYYVAGCAMDTAKSSIVSKVHLKDCDGVLKPARLCFIKLTQDMSTRSAAAIECGPRFRKATRDIQVTLEKGKPPVTISKGNDDGEYDRPKSDKAAFSLKDHWAQCEVPVNVACDSVNANLCAMDTKYLSEEWYSVFFQTVDGKTQEKDPFATGATAN